MNTPILFLIFNRYDTTIKVFESIKNQKPKYLFIAADGPRESRQEDILKCKEVRNYVLGNIDWDCDVKTLFRDTNLGCGKAVSEAITWFFQQVDQGIILEDDCLPQESFFLFCEQMLEKYKNNLQISSIAGNNFQTIQPMNISEDYYFSVFPHIWGWATWKRTWDNYDFNISNWTTINRKKFLKHVFKNKEYRNYWEFIYNKMSRHEIDTWDFQLFFSCWNNKQLAVIPKVNLVTNIGCGNDATHTTDLNDKQANMPVGLLNFPLNHPEIIIRNKKADNFTQQRCYGKIYKKNLIERVLHKILRIVRKNILTKLLRSEKDLPVSNGAIK